MDPEISGLNQEYNRNLSYHTGDCVSMIGIGNQADTPTSVKIIDIQDAQVFKSGGILTARQNTNVPLYCSDWGI